MKAIVYEDENIVVIYKDGKSDFLFITFGDSVSLASGLDMYAESVVTKLSYASLSIMPKARNWYPYDSMQKAINCCRDVLGKFQVRLSYSGSMGAYAAIKYSKDLKTTHTIACCPQWSIAPKDCIGIKNKYEKYFHESMADMSIKSGDVSGDIYVIYDPKHKVDNFHFSKIRQNSHKIYAVKMPFIRHHVTTVIAGTNNIRMMVEAVLDRDSLLLNRIVTKIRRASALRKDNVLRTGSQRHPVITAKAIISSQLNTEGAIDAMSSIVNTLLITKQFGVLRSLVGHMKEIHSGSSEFEKMYSSLNKLIKNDVRSIKSFHGDRLMYDPLSSSIRQAKVCDETIGIGIYSPLFLMNIDGEDALVVERNDGYSPVICCGSAFVPVAESSINESKGMMIRAIPAYDGRVSFYSNGLYLSANKSGQVHLKCDYVKDWETFEVC